jgi:hypothetical protein
LARRLRSHPSSWSNDDIDHICLDFDLAVLHHLEWVEARQQAQDLVDAESPGPKAKPTTIVPRYKTFEEVLALDGQDDDIRVDEATGAERRSSLSRDQIRERADELLRDPKARERFFRGEE